MSTDQTATLNEMIEVLNDGKKFYDEAAAEVQRDDLKGLFQRMSAHKAALVASLSSKVRALGEKPATDGTFVGSMRKLYAEVRTKMSSDKDHEYIAQLEEFEDRIKHTFEHAVGSNEDSSVRQIADQYYSSVKKDHDQMRDLKKGVAVAATRA